jgi:regulator of protease activity HflC (stomatin/prohibitin superfamily)
MGTLIFLILFGVTFLVSIFIWKSMHSKKHESQYGFLSAALISAVIFIFTWFVGALYIVDDGEVALLRSFGKVYGTEEESGVHMKKPWADRILWNVRLTSKDVVDMQVRTKDEVVVRIDLTFYYAVISNKLVDMYVNIAKDPDVLLEGFIIPEIGTAMKDEISKLAYRELNGKRESIGKAITKYTAEVLKDKFVRLNNIKIGEITPPESIDRAIQEKEAEKQKVAKADQQILLAEKKAIIKAKEARGIANAQDIIQKKLTPLYVQWYAIEQYGDLAKSKNTTFVIMPTSSKSTGIPLILNGSGVK